MIGTTLAHYRIDARIGEGGMGVVYRALDTHLDRRVAIKVLRAEAVADPDRKKRFIQEARLASSLSHPNIITIYDIACAEGVDYIAMEYVAGRTLDQVIGRRGLPCVEALKYAIPVAAALARAHKAGIVHRDLKPANIIVGDDGIVKVLDFGLAKLIEASGDEGGATASIQNSPRTEEGAIVGTAAYMSPEQVAGCGADERADIFAFGCVLYEMLTGERAFHGQNKISTLSAILHKEPQPLHALAGTIPPELERLVERCLRKDPGRRIQHMDDVKLTLEDLRQDSESGRTAVPGSAPPRRPLALWAVVAAALVASAIGAWTLWPRRADTSSGPILHRLTSDAGLATDPAISRDGKLVAFASDRAGEGNLDIWVMQRAGGTVARSRLTHHEADDSQPEFSPDGSQIAFRSEREGGGIYIVSTLGGEAQLAAPRGYNPRFSPDGKRIACWDGAIGTFLSSASFVVPVAGGSPRRLLPDWGRVTAPTWSPDGKSILFSGVRQLGPRLNEEYDWWVTPADGGGAVRTGLAALLRARKMNPTVLPSVWIGDTILFSLRLGDSVNIWQVSISPRTFQVSDLRRLTAGSGNESSPSMAGDTVVYAELSETTYLWSLPLSRSGLAGGELQRLTNDAAQDWRPRLPRDGSFTVFQSTRSGNVDLWRRDLATGKETALTATPNAEFWPVVRPDGGAVAYTTGYTPSGEIRMVPAAGGISTVLCADCGRPESWSPDGRYLLYHLGDSRQSVKTGLLDTTTGAQTLIAEKSGKDLNAPRFSPDGKWIVFYERVSPQTRRIWVLPFHGTAAIPETDWIPITAGDGLDREPRWSADGNALYYTSMRDGFLCIWMQRLQPATKRPNGEPVAVLHLHRARLSARAPDAMGMECTADRMILSLEERGGSIWQASFARSSPR